MEKLLLRSNFSSFPHYFIYIFLTSGVKLHNYLLNVVVQFIVVLTLSTLICRSTDISKCFNESLGIRDNESRLYMLHLYCLAVQAGFFSDTIEYWPVTQAARVQSSAAALVIRIFSPVTSYKFMSVK